MGAPLRRSSKLSNCRFLTFFLFCFLSNPNVFFFNALAFFSAFSPSILQSFDGFCCCGRWLDLTQVCVTRIYKMRNMWNMRSAICICIKCSVYIGRYSDRRPQITVGVCVLCDDDASTTTNRVDKGKLRPRSPESERPLVCVWRKPTTICVLLKSPPAASRLVWYTLERPSKKRLGPSPPLNICFQCCVCRSRHTEIESRTVIKWVNNEYCALFTCVKVKSMFVPLESRRFYLSLI